MKIHLHILCMAVVFTMYSFAAYTQNHAIDSLQKVWQTQKEVNTLNELSWSLILNEDYNTALQYAKQTLSLTNKI
jgi:hypothetical protein